MAEVKVGEHTFQIERNGDAISINGVKTNIKHEKISEDVLRLTSTTHHKQSEIECIELDVATRKVTVSVNSHTYEVEVKSDFDQLLESLGMGPGSTARLNDIKAPMPGMVLDIMVTAGQTVSKDEPLLILEAMKMENVIKSPRDGEIMHVGVSKGAAIEKNTLLVEFKN